MKRTWIKGPRIATGRRGKNQGPVFEQKVTLVMTPKGAA